jgi:hypothetical protein
VTLGGMSLLVGRATMDDEVSLEGRGKVDSLEALKKIGRLLFLL